MLSAKIRIKVSLCAALGLLLLVPAASAGSEWDLTPAHEMIGQLVKQAVVNDLGFRHGEDFGETCILTPELALCIHPDTPPEQVEEILRRLPTWEGDRYVWGGRWTSTATDGPTGGWGNPITLTYSFVPDGLYIPGANGEPGSPSTLYAEMNFHFDSPAVWKPMFAEFFELWGSHIGVTYIEVEDDGAPFPNMPGEIGARGDVRMSAHYIDGQGGVLAYNRYPAQGGDTVFDDAEYWSQPHYVYRMFRNTVTHEHGHGLGLSHVLPNSCQKLMESALCMNFDGPQDDDIRGGMRNYGDFLENDDDYATANDLGAFTGDHDIQTLSLNDRYDEDWFEFEVTAGSEIDLTLDPVGFSYLEGNEVIHTHQIQDLQVEVRNGADGSNVLVHKNETPAGQNEELTDFALAPGVHFIRVFSGPDETSDVQRYDLFLNLEITDPTAAPGGAAPVAGLGMQVFPNPFNPKTMARFYAPEAGSVSLQIYDVAGALVRDLEARASAPGWMSVEWNGLDDAGRSAPSGVYFLNARIGGHSETVRAVLLK